MCSENELGDQHYKKVNTPPIVQALWSIKHWGLCQEWTSPLSLSLPLPDSPQSPDFRVESLRRRLFTLSSAGTHTQLMHPRTARVCTDIRTNLLCILHLVAGS